MKKSKSEVKPTSAVSAAVPEQTAATFKVKVMPRASRNSIEGWESGEWKVKLTAPPAEGAANTMLIHFLAEVLGVPRRHVTIIGGQRARNKLVRIDGLTAEQIKQQLTAEN